MTHESEIGTLSGLYITSWHVTGGVGNMCQGLIRTKKRGLFITVLMTVTRSFTITA
jgi:hypothetical protein